MISYYISYPDIRARRIVDRKETKEEAVAVLQRVKHKLFEEIANLESQIERLQ